MQVQLEARTVGDMSMLNFLNTPERTPSPMGVYQLLLRGALAPVRAARGLGRVVIALGVLVAISVLAEQFGVRGAAYVGLGVLIVASLWYTHADARRVRAADGSAKLVWLYTGGVLITFPFSYAMLVLLGFAVWIAFVMLLGKIAWFFFRPGRSTPTPTVRRGANSHVNADGSAKLSYVSKADASRAALKYEADFGAAMNIYECGNGGHFHIGHRERPSK